MLIVFARCSTRNEKFKINNDVDKTRDNIQVHQYTKIMKISMFLLRKFY